MYILIETYSKTYRCSYSIESFSKAMGKTNGSQSSA
jgi:hypothetical protein